ncbi:RNA-directed DNA polymerase, eukaryota, reverse transcriptase zinc-binding domain protein [Tanacetum coccineum]
MSIYAPQNLTSKIALWSILLNLATTWDGITVMMGDFNEVRDASERFGSVFIERQATVFNEFINDASLTDVPLGGYNYTWTDKWGSKMSKLDPFLVSEKKFDAFPHSTGVILEKGLPDHRPILLKEFHVDYGPTPFRFFHSWLEMDGFRKLVVDTWNNDGISNANGMIPFKKKLQNLKKLFGSTATEEDFQNRRDSHTFLGSLDRLEAKDLAQKAKVKWAEAGDENMSFFHNTLKKRRQLTIKGILKDGEWIEDPSSVKAEFADHLLEVICNWHTVTPPTLDTNMLNPLHECQRDFLERPFTRDEIKGAV